MVAIIGFFLAGCGLAPYNLVKKEGRAYIDKYPLNQLAVQRAIKEHRLVFGMTMDEVVLSWGTPTKQDILSVNSVLYNVWIYSAPTHHHMLYFHRGILTDIKY